MENLNALRDIEALKISLASSEEILSWSYGEVTKPETINYRTFKPERDGLFCERIFGPQKDYECTCGKYKRIRYKGVICDRCGVQVTTSKVRRERMGHLNLASPVVHVWFFKNIPSVLATLLGIAPRSVELVIYFSSFIVTDIDQDAKNEILSTFEDKIADAREFALNNVLAEAQAAIDEAENKVKSLSKEPEEKWTDSQKKKAQEIRNKANDLAEEIKGTSLAEQEKAEYEIRKIEKKLMEVELHTVMTDKEYIQLEEFLDEFCEVSIGAEAIKKVLDQVNLEELRSEIREEIITAKSTKLDKLKKRLRVVDGFIKGNVKPTSMIVEVLPVIPPDLRPMVMLEGGRFATSDLNDLYRRIINRNNRLKRLLELGAPDIIVRNEKRMLQEAVDALFDSSKVRKSRTRDRKTYRSIADAIKGKSGHFRANLLGKRVDYSGRAVIVSGPSLKMNECGLPTEMALELFKPFLIREIMRRGLAPNMKTAKYILEDRPAEIYTILEELVSKRPVLLNRAPTLHRLSIQAFFPKLTDSKAIQLHPVVCSGFNADFDGDQMAVHLPLSEKAVQEAIDLMISTNNLLKPSDGSVVTIPSHEMVLGLYYLTSINDEIVAYPRLFTNFDQIFQAYGNNVVSLRQKVKVLYNGEILETTPGRVIMNKYIPEGMDYVNHGLSKSEVKKLIKKAMEKIGIEKTIDLIDNLKLQGFNYSTKSGISLSIFDCVKPKDLDEIMNKSYAEVAENEMNFNMGLITKSELSKLNQAIWKDAQAHFDKTILSSMTSENPVNIVISASAGKASPNQIRQISAFKGVIADPQGKLIDMPVLGNYSTGMSSFDYFLSARGMRKTYMDKGLGTADAGYLTRRLVNVAQDVIVREEDCGSTEGRVIARGENTLLYQWQERLIGRYTLKDIKSGSKVIVKAGEIITESIASEIDKEEKISQVVIRSALNCKTFHGVCAKCYGQDLSTKKDVQIGVAVGIVAAQSIGEPGTQLTMNVFHSGGIAGENITQGLPRVEELFELRRSKRTAIISQLGGRVKFDYGQDIITINIENDSSDVETYKVDANEELFVKDGDLIGPGTQITAGSLDIKELYSAVGTLPAQKYILSEVQKVYGSQGVAINDKHLEVIIKQMFNKVRVFKSGTTSLLPGDVISVYKFNEENELAKKMGGEVAEAKNILLGISKASRMSESWLDAASFEETSSVLTESAISGSIDRLIGLKENVIIGRRIPVGNRQKVSNSEEEV